MNLILIGLTFLALGVTAFNDDDNKHGYNGRCPPGWDEIDQMCYKAKHQEEDFRGALDECTSHRDNYHMYWEQGARWLGPRYNLMPVEMLHSLLDHGQNHPKLGRGPYRVNAIKTSHDHKWREYDGGETNIDVYRWRGGREIDFSMFPDFNEEWGSSGDSLVWYPHNNKLYARPHYHKYDTLCYRRKEDAERCPGTPTSNYHGDCYNGKCYCYEGWYGEDCCCKPKLLAVGGDNDKSNTVNADSISAKDTTELFDFETATSCMSLDFPDDVIGGELQWFEGELCYCGGGNVYAGSGNVTECWKFSPADEDWVQMDVEETLRPLLHADSVIVPKFGWWFISGIFNSDDPRTELIALSDRSFFTEGPPIPSTFGGGGLWDHCAVAITDTRVVIIGGKIYDNTTAGTHLQIYDFESEDWLDAGETMTQGFEGHECGLLMDPECGHPVVVIIGGGDVDGKVHIWDTITNELRETNFDHPADIDDSAEPWIHMAVTQHDEMNLIVSGGSTDAIDYGEIYSFNLKDGFTKLGMMKTERSKHNTEIVWGPDFKCDESA